MNNQEMWTRHLSAVSDSNVFDTRIGEHLTTAPPVRHPPLEPSTYLYYLHHDNRNVIVLGSPPFGRVLKLPMTLSQVVFIPVVYYHRRILD